MAVLAITLFCLFSLFSIIQAETDPPSFLISDKMGNKQKDVFKKLINDLLRQAILKMRQIVDIRAEHDKSISFNIGMLMGRIREKYRFMTEHYRDIVDKYHNRSWIHPPAAQLWRPLHYFLVLERIHYLEIEIDKLVDVMVDEATHELPRKRVKAGQTDPPTTSKDDKTTKRPNLRSDKEIVREAVVKSFMRERFLMRKLGNPVNMTTAKKRFLRKWPVEDSWSLDKYNQDYK